MTFSRTTPIVTVGTSFSKFASGVRHLGRDRVICSATQMGVVSIPPHKQLSRHSDQEELDCYATVLPR